MALSARMRRVTGGLMPQVAPRKPRTPQHPFFVTHRPFSIQPFFIAPVLPGETMKLLLLQARAVSAPIANPLIGGWLEYWVFYVKHRDLNERDVLTEMMVDPAAGTGVTPQSGTDDKYFTADGTVPWVKMCLTRIVEEYFRLPGEAWNVETDSEGLPVAMAIGDHWLDSFQWQSEMPTGPDVDVDANTDSTITAREVQTALQQYELLRSMGMIEQTYEDYLASFGIRTPEQELHRPELVRYIRNWAYPVNHVSTEGESAGDATSAMSWKIAERADKDRFFREPGFLFGVTCWRPKIYLGDQVGTASGLLDNLLAWLPAAMRGDSSVSLRKLETNTAILPNLDVDATPGPADPAWIDLRDLFLYGEQFVAGTVPNINLPDANGRRRYPPQADIANLFSGATQTISQDGLVALTILGTQADATLATPRPTRAV